ncbi:imidazolonepropionase [Streptomyces sp. NPDC047002]|uniref:imidazolonepropionase n=1 Tax=Streptomyces sp. NPDC047002 TaxID=3155475 RepID=UPI0034511352
MSPALAVVDAEVATMASATGNPSGADGAGYGLIHDAALVLDGGRVAWVGPRGELPRAWASAEPYSAGGRLVTPGLVECHTHLLFAGDRREEFGAAARGEPVPAGGGVHRTVAATWEASEDDILAAALRRARWLVRQGVTTLEVKTGYGLEPGAELRLLRIAERLRAALPVRTLITLLAGHAYPAGADREEYVLRVCDELLPAAIESGVPDFVEVYCEDADGISMEDASTILETAYRRKVPTRLSADRLSDSAGGALAPAFYAKAAAHLVHTDDIAVTAIGRAGTTAVLLPGAALGPGADDRRPPVGLLRTHGVPMAVSTGCNPGTSPLADPRAAAHLGVSLFGLELPEALHGITSTAARALALADGTGTLAPGAPADLAVWDAAHPAELLLWMGAPLCHEVWAAGV